MQLLQRYETHMQLLVSRTFCPKPLYFISRCNLLFFASGNRVTSRGIPRERKINFSAKTFEDNYQYKVKSTVERQENKPLALNQTRKLCYNQETCNGQLNGSANLCRQLHTQILSEYFTLFIVSQEFGGREYKLSIKVLQYLTLQRVAPII